LTKYVITIGIRTWYKLFKG